MPNRWVGSGKTVIRRQSGSSLDPSATSLLTNLISWWKLDEASGTRVDSVSGNDLTDNNTVTQAVGKVGSAGQFTSANSEDLSRADNASLSTGDIDFTFACWVYLDTLANETFVSKWAGEYLLFYNSSDHATNQRFSFAVANGSNVFVDANNFGLPSTATWYFLVAWHDAAADTINIQVNNGTADSTSTAAGVADGASTFRIGSLGAYYMNGRVDEVGFWKRTLTAAEKTYLYNAGAGRTWSASGIV